MATQKQNEILRKFWRGQVVAAAAAIREYPQLTEKCLFDFLNESLQIIESEKMPLKEVCHALFVADLELAGDKKKAGKNPVKASSPKPTVTRKKP